MPETLQEWYEWAMKLDRQYCQEQAESKLFRHASSSSKFGKLSGKSAEKNPALTLHIEWALPLATAVTLECSPDAMDIDCTGRCPLIKCLIVERLVTIHICQERKGKFGRHILKKKKN
jgi:hypothetical protein